MRTSLPFALSAALLLPLAGLAPAQQKPDPATLQRRIDELEQRVAELITARDHGSYTPPEQRLAWYERHVAMTADTPFAEAQWQFLGPTNLSGRVTDVAIAQPRGATYTMYVAGASGGVWKTTNEGTTWEPVFEHAPSTSIGDIALAPSDPQQLWVGTGEANIFRSSFAGAGVFKSSDGGETFANKGLTGTHTIARIVVDPSDPDVVYVAASGHEWTDNPERGVYKTTDGGESWQQVLFVDERTGAIDLVMHPGDPQTLYAATWERRRKRWNDPRNHPESRGSGIWKTTNGGADWTPINAGLPEARHRGRIGIDLCRAQPDTLYAFVDNYQLDPDFEPGGRDSYGRERKASILGATVYRSDDGGTQWRQVSESDRYMMRLSATYGWVFGQIRVDPVDPDRLYVMGLALNVSEDGGESFRRLRGMHGDHHALWIDPQNTDYLVNGNDGGANVSYDGGATWKHFTDELPMVQFFNVAYDMDEPFRVYGSIQDHGSFRAVVDLERGRRRIPAQDWERAPGGEGSYHAIDPTDPDVVYSAGFYGRIRRSHLDSGERANIMPEVAEGEPRPRGQWLAPFLLSPHNPRILYHGLNRVYRSWDRGDDFQPISPDLTWNDPATMGDIPFHTITALTESPRHFGILYAGTDDGRAHVTRDGGDHWQEITRGLRPHRWISRIEPSRAQDGLVYLAQNGKRHDDFTPYLWRSTDYGATWHSIAGGIPCGPINVVREDPADPALLWVGTDLGVYVSPDEGTTWHAVPGNLPSTFVADLVIHPRDDIAVAATHGRGMYALDARRVRAIARTLRGEEPEGEESSEDDDMRPAGG